MRTIGAAKAKAHFLTLLDEVASRREPILVTKNGTAVAQVVPLPLAGTDPIFGFLKGKIQIVGDVVSPTVTEEEYGTFLAESAAQLS